ncbi:MAG: hypothetical protein GY858_06945, partial [Candidatus Omnitrophica bacterium]|nr:hypothetical protein [Candidatus Omnitrophota bacterium]
TTISVEVQELVNAGVLVEGEKVKDKKTGRIAQSYQLDDEFIFMYTHDLEGGREALEDLASLDGMNAYRIPADKKEGTYRDIALAIYGESDIMGNEIDVDEYVVEALARSGEYGQAIALAKKAEDREYRSRRLGAVIESMIERRLYDQLDDFALTIRGAQDRADILRESALAQAKEELYIGAKETVAKMARKRQPSVMGDIAVIQAEAGDLVAARKTLKEDVKGKAAKIDPAGELITIHARAGLYKEADELLELMDGKYYQTGVAARTIRNYRLAPRRHDQSATNNPSEVTVSVSTYRLGSDIKKSGRQITDIARAMIVQLYQSGEIDMARRVFALLQYNHHKHWKDWRAVEAINYESAYDNALGQDYMAQSANIEEYVDDLMEDHYVIIPGEILLLGDNGDEEDHTVAELVKILFDEELETIATKVEYADSSGLTDARVNATVEYLKADGKPRKAKQLQDFIDNHFDVLYAAHLHGESYLTGEPDERGFYSVEQRSSYNSETRVDEAADELDEKEAMVTDSSLEFPLSSSLAKLLIARGVLGNKDDDSSGDGSATSTGGIDWASVSKAVQTKERGIFNMTMKDLFFEADEVLGLKANLVLIEKIEDPNNVFDAKKPFNQAASAKTKTENRPQKRHFPLPAEPLALAIKVNNQVVRKT